MVSEIVLVSHWLYSKIPTCCLSKSTIILLIFFGPLIEYETEKEEPIEAFAEGELRFILILVSGFSSLHAHICVGATAKILLKV